MPFLYRKLIKKTLAWLPAYCFLTLITILISCDKPKREPKVITGEITDITINSARASGNIIDVGDGITDHGHCWSLSPGATVSNFKTMHGAISRTGSYPSILQSLQPGTKYYIKAYVENANGDFYYGGESSFTTTSIAPPTVITLSVASITSTTATSGGNVTSDGGAVVTARGVCWSTSPNPTTSNSKTSNGSGTGSYTSNLTGLTANTTYHVRAYATNSTGIAYGNDLTFTTPPDINLPTVTTGTTTATSSTTATSGGNVTSDGGSAVTARGVCWSMNYNPTVSLSTKTTNGSGTGSFTSSITGLLVNTTYYLRAYATNSAGTAYGNQISFITLNESSLFKIVKLDDGNSYDFSEEEFGWASGGDFYFFYELSEKFWANNVGQRGIQDLGNLGQVDLNAVIPPENGYTRYGVDVFTDHTYVSLAQEGEEGHYIILKVLEASPDSVKIQYYYR